MGAIITAILSAIPAITQILNLVDKWFGKSPEEKAVGKYKKAVEENLKISREIAQAVKEMKKGKAKTIEDILNGKK